MAWEHLSDAALFAEWITVYFNLDASDPYVKDTLVKLEEALYERRKRAMVKADAVLPARQHGVRREPETPDVPDKGEPGGSQEMLPPPLEEGRTEAP